MNKLPDTGYYIHHDEQVFLAIDGGIVGPDHLMAHAHADVFSYELCLEGLPIVIDTGVYEYQAGEMRNYVRATAAHSTLSIDGMDQVECWGSFRVARRFAPHDIRFVQSDGKSMFEGRFSGYASLVGDEIQHHRTITVDPSNRTVTVTDNILGKGVHTAESRVQLHPEVSILEEDNSYILQRESIRCRLETDSLPVRWEDGWYCPRFGRRERNNVLVIGGETPLPARIAYRFRY